MITQTGDAGSSILCKQARALTRRLISVAGPARADHQRGRCIRKLRATPRRVLAEDDQQVGRHVQVSGGPRRRGRRVPRAQIIMTSMYPMATLIAILWQAANLGASAGWLAELRCVVRAAPGGCGPLATAGWAPRS
jgi:hypothetical protein